jgi:hypothetical protein
MIFIMIRYSIADTVIKGKYRYRTSYCYLLEDYNCITFNGEIPATLVGDFGLGGDDCSPPTVHKIRGSMATGTFVQFSYTGDYRPTGYRNGTKSLHKTSGSATLQENSMRTQSLSNKKNR